jgi:gliding motility-associated-like protein
MKKRSSVFTKCYVVFFMLLALLFGTAEASVYQVTTTAFTGAGSISQAVTNANGTVGKDTIYFSIPTGPFTITMSSELVITDDVLIDGTSQTGYNAAAPSPVVQFINSPAMAFIVNGGASEIRSIAINACALGIVYNTSNNKLTGCYIGLGLDGVTNYGNSGHGVIINNPSVGNIIGGTTLALRNVISGNTNGHGIIVTSSSSNYFIGNYIGTNAAGNAAVSNSFMGIQMDNSPNNTIGGITSDSSNLISGNGQNGIQIIGGNGNRIMGNIIGLQSDKSSALGNLQQGIYINGCNNTQIGGIGASSGNIISANSSLGIQLEGCVGTVIKSNIIGTSFNTQTARGNLANNIQLVNSPKTIIGGNHLTEGNIISASSGAGINFQGSGSNKTIIKGNYIGTDNTGTLALGNSVIGIILKSDSCTIGGTNPGEGNIIVDTKTFCGILIANASNNLVQGNFIGAGADTSAIPNKTHGISISVEISGDSASNNIIQNNVIAYNNENGINVGGTALSGLNTSNNQLYNNLRFNSIFCNLQLGISLNLSNSADWGNNGKTAPQINNALSNSTKVVGVANGLLSTDLIDIYEMTACANCNVNPQGKKYIATISPDASGNWAYSPSSPISGTLIAMATDVKGNSSQFSLCFTPCSAKAVASSGNYTSMLDVNKPQTVTLTSSSTFSNINPMPGKIFWSMGVPDTTASGTFSDSASTSLTFAIGGAAGSYGPGLYTIYLIAKQSGCIDTTKLTLNFFFIPNMITPNGDHLNDQWTVGNATGQFDAKIFNRWGDLVYSKTDYTNEWDGSGLSEGVYYYHLDDKTQSGKSYKGWVEVLK